MAHNAACTAVNCTRSRLCILQERIPGVGTATAERIVDAFGDDTVKVLSGADAEERLAAIDRISPALSAKIVKIWQQLSRSDDWEAEKFMASFRSDRKAVPPKVVKRIIRTLKGETESRLKADPYAALLHVKPRLSFR